MSSFNKKAVLAGVCIAAAYAYMVHRFWFVTDDAYISFRYAHNWASGAGLRYNLGEHPPVEGYSNFLWVTLCGVIEWLGLNPEVFAPSISALAGGLLLYRVYGVATDRLKLHRLVSFWVVAFLALLPAYGVWATGGLATMPFALCLFCIFEWTVFEAKGSAFVKAGIMSVIAALLRVEGVVWTVGIVAVAVMARPREHPMPRRGLVLFSGLLVLGVGLFLLWRYNYYGRWFPNTVDAKSGLTLPILKRGFDYVIVFFLSFVSFFVLIPASIVALLKQYRPAGVPLVVCSWAAVAYAIGVGGDFMAMGRFFVPAFPFVALLSGVLLSHFWSGSWVRRGALLVLAVLSIGVNLLPGWDIHVVPETQRARFHFRFNKPSYNSEYQQWVLMDDSVDRWKQLGRALGAYAKPGDSLVIGGGMGCVGYYSELFIYDRYGLLDDRVRERPLPTKLRSPGHDRVVPVTYFLKDKPTYLLQHLIEGRQLKKRTSNSAKMLLKWAARIGYVPDIKVFRDNGEVKLLLLLRRLRPGEVKGHGIARFKQAVTRFNQMD